MNIPLWVETDLEIHEDTEEDFTVSTSSSMILGNSVSYATLLMSPWFQNATGTCLAPCLFKLEEFTRHRKDTRGCIQYIKTLHHYTVLSSCWNRTLLVLQAFQRFMTLVSKNWSSDLLNMFQQQYRHQAPAFALTKYVQAPVIRATEKNMQNKSFSNQRYDALSLSYRAALRAYCDVRITLATHSQCFYIMYLFSSSKASESSWQWLCSWRVESKFTDQVINLAQKHTGPWACDMYCFANTHSRTHPHQ